MEFKHGELTNRIPKAFHTVYQAQGYGFLEKVYENSMAIELRKAQMTVQQQFPISDSVHSVFVRVPYLAKLVLTPALSVPPAASAG